jgi:hypothetical protein
LPDIAGHCRTLPVTSLRERQRAGGYANVLYGVAALRPDQAQIIFA